MPVCFLHVGSHKTGTTAIQSFLAKNREALDGHNLLVPKAGASPLGSHRTLVCDMLGMPVSPGLRGSFEQLKAEMAGRPGHDIVVSAEIMETLFRRDVTKSPLVSFFQKAGYEVKTILYVRNVPQWLNSRYTQNVKMFVSNVEFAKVVDRVVSREHSYLTTWVEFVRNNGCGMLAGAYTGAVQSGGVVEDFAGKLGIGWTTAQKHFVMPERANETIGPITVAVARRIMSDIPGGVRTVASAERSKCGRVLLREMRKLAVRDPRFSGLDSAGARRLEAHFLKSNDIFAEAFWQKTWGDVFAADMNEEFTINDLAQKPMTPEEGERVDALFRKVWSKVGPVIEAARAAPRARELRRPRGEAAD